MKIICGLGNPGREFEGSYHNLGFTFLNTLREVLKFAPFYQSKDYLAELSFGKIKNEKIFLLKPITFMNNSGEALKIFFRKFKKSLPAESLIVVHDDIDIPLGKVKIVKGKGSAGHKGVQSIIDALKTKNFFRIRIGICQERKPKKNLSSFVLKKVAKKEREILEKIIKKTAFLLKDILEKKEIKSQTIDFSLLTAKKNFVKVK